MTKNLRRIQRLENGEWADTTMDELRVGQRFRMFESSGEQVVDTSTGQDSWVVISGPYFPEGMSTCVEAA